LTVLTVFDDWYTVGTVLVDLSQLVHRWFWVFFTDWYSVPFVKYSQKTVKTAKMTIGVPIVTCLPKLYQQCTNCQKQSKDSQKSKKWPLVYQSSHVYTESAEYTKPSKRCYLARSPSHVPGQWPQPVARGQGWLYMSTWTSMRLAPVRCRVLLHSLLPTDDACSSFSLSTTVIKFSIFSDPTRKFSALSRELCRIR